MLGVMPGAQYATHALNLSAGDRLVLYTDGVTEAFNAAAEAYGEQRLIAEVRACGGGPAATVVESICRSVTQFAGGAAQSDDITLSVLAWQPESPDA